MLDPIKISYKLTINVSVTYCRILQYPVNTIYNTRLGGNHDILGGSFFNLFYTKQLTTEKM